MASKLSLLLYPHFLLLLISSISAPNPQFNQRSTRFFEFEQKTNRWVEILSPYDLTSCSNDTCIKIGSIDTNPITNTKLDSRSDSRAVLRIRKRVSVTAMSEASVWITGQSGSIFERFWNGVMWVVAPHDLPEVAVAAVEVFVVSQSVLALSEDGMIYQSSAPRRSSPTSACTVLTVPTTCQSPNEKKHLEQGKARMGTTSSAISPALMYDFRMRAMRPVAKMT